MPPMPVVPPAIEPAAAHAGWRYGLSLLACGLTAGLALPFYGVLDLSNIVMLFLLTVVLVAVKAGGGPAVMASLVSVVLFDFLFVPPRFSLAVSHAQYLVTFAVMLAVSLLVGHLTAGLRAQATAAAGRERIARALYGLARALAGAMSVEQVAEAVAGFLRDNWGAECVLLLEGDGERLIPAPGTATHLEPPELVMARTACEAGRGLVFAEGEIPERHFLPMIGATRNRGALVVRMNPVDEPIRPLLEAVAALACTAVERLHFVEVAHSAQVEAVSERLRSSILSALSHDVRTPLTALFGMADSLVVQRPPLPDAARETAAAIRDQVLRVNGMVGNLLDMARLQTGPVSLRREWQPVEEVIGAGLKLLEPALAGHPVLINGLDALPLLEFDAVLLERVFCNLFENAAKYSPPGTPIRLDAVAGLDVVELRVTSGGEGFPPDKLEAVFNLFERGRSETAVAGMGVGLAICRAIVEAHGGSIRASNPPEGGACVAFTLPRGNPPVIDAEPFANPGERP